MITVFKPRETKPKSIKRIRRCCAVFLVLIVTFVTIGLSRVNSQETKQKGIKRIRRCCAVFLFLIVTDVPNDLSRVNP